jgi:hypothetical protein
MRLWTFPLHAYMTATKELTGEAGFLSAVHTGELVSSQWLKWKAGCMPLRIFACEPSKFNDDERFLFERPR